MNDIVASLIFGGGGGSGSGNYTKKGLASYDVTPIDAQYVTDSYKGSSAADKTLANCPSLSTLLSTFYDKYVGANLTSYTVTKKSLGKDQSNTYDIYEYDFKPAKWDRMILLTSGMHGYEVSAIFGLAYFMENIIEHHTGDDFLTYLYTHVRIKVIPVISPWAYSQSPKSYVQSRGVNINRNFDYNGEWATYDPGSNPNNNKGTAPFSEAETQILRQWASENYGAEFWIDCHTSVDAGTYDKEIYSSTISNTPLIDEVDDAHEKLEAWTKQYYNLNSLNTKYMLDSTGAMKGRWYTGVYGKTMFVIEQCSDCDTMGLTYNGDRNAIVNYTAQISGYVGAFLVKADETVNKNQYIQDLQQEAIENLKYIGQEEVEPTPEPTTLYVYQGTLKSTDGTPSESTTRVYTAEVPISHDEFHIIGFGSGYRFGGRCYDSNSDYLVPITDNLSNSHVAFKNAAEHDGAWGTASDVTIVVGSEVTDFTKLRLIIRYDTDDTDIEPSDVEDKEISIDGVTYKLAVTEEATSLDVYQGTLKSSDGTPTSDNMTRVYTADIPITTSGNEFHITGFGNGYWFGGRCYDSSGNYLKAISDGELSANVYYKNAGEHDGAWGTASDVTIHIGSQVSGFTKLKLIVRTQLGTDNLAPSDVEDMEISVDGVAYKLTVGT